MFKPSLYTNYNALPRSDALDCLMRHSQKFKWGNNDKMIDLGCGDGSVTIDVLKKFLPNDCTLVGCDISESMIDYCNSEFRDSITSFVVQDVGGHLKEGLKEAFDHVFSTYALHWIQDQMQVFSNIHKLLTEGGDCLLLIVGRTYVYDCYRIMMKKPYWQQYMKDAEKYISPYQDLQEPDKRVHGIMAQVGFKEILVTCEEKTYDYEAEYFKNTMEAICPFDIPADMKTLYREDFIQAARELKAVEDRDGKTIVKMQYSLITVSGTK